MVLSKHDAALVSQARHDNYYTLALLTTVVVFFTQNPKFKHDGAQADVVDAHGKQTPLIGQ